jgi:hypothetical protein
MTLEQIYEQKCNDNSDICQHLPTLRNYALLSESIVELGVRSIVSTYAFLMGAPKWLMSVDIHHPQYYSDYDPEGCNLDLVEKLAAKQGTTFSFHMADSRKIVLPICDLMFFDTLHTYEQLTAELKAHGHKVNKYMIFHDTVTYKDELYPAIVEYCLAYPNWHILEVWYNNNGMIVLQNKNSI